MLLCEAREDISKPILEIETLALSESECLDQLTTSEESEVESPDQSPDFSDGYISDEESLIEIAINPSGHFVGHKQFSDFSPRSILKHHSIMELLSEFAEEDNLFEIDLSIGSIKCSSRLMVSAIDKDFRRSLSIFDSPMTGRWGFVPSSCKGMPLV
ncbi:hypothetical protein ACFE04_029717 [Oxalis oulophora]